MANLEKTTARRSQTSYITTVISIALVLWMVGLMGLILLHAQRLSDYVKENIGFTVMLQEDARETETVKLRKTLDASEYVKSTRFINKEEAAEIMQDDLGSEFVEFLGFNPLTASIDVNLNAPYANPDSVAWIKKDLAANPMVKEVIYQESLVESIHENVNKITLIMLGFSALLFVISVALINNTIRLSIYSKRFLIKSMQLVGATRIFITRPFLWKGVVQGLVAGLISIALLIAIMLYAQQEIPDLKELQDKTLVLVIFASLLVLGVFLSVVSTGMAVRRFLRSKSEALY